MSEELLLELKKEIKELNKKLNIYGKEVFNSTEAAEYLRIGYGTLLSLTRAGAIEYVPNGASYIYKKEFLDNWLNKNRSFK